MNHRRQLVVVSVLILAFTLACRTPTGEFRLGIVRGSGNVVTESRDIGAVDAVELGTLGTLEIEIGGDPELRIEAEDNIQPLIRTEVRNGRLIIDNQPERNFQATRSVRYYLRVESLERIELSASGDARAPALSADTFTIRVSSSGDLEIASLTCDTCNIHLSSSGDVEIGNLDATALDVQISSSGDLTIDEGQVTRQEITLSSSGTYNARGLRSNRAEVRLQSSGNAYLWVEEDLRGRLSSSGDLIYRGDPTLDVSTSSSGRVRRD
jgi:hypothetical protein